MTEPHPLDQAAPFLDRLGAARVLCIGDAMLDRTVEGSVERISPEAPIPVLQVAGTRSAPGGAANVAANLAALGVRTRFLASVGDDAEADELARLMTGGIDAELLRDASRPTTLKTRYVAGTQQLLRADRERPGPPGPALAERLVALAAERMADADLVVLSDYGKGMLAAPLASALIAAARDRRLPVLVDPKGRDWSRYRGATLVTPNRSELAAAFGEDLADDAAVGHAASAMRQATGIDWLLATLGAEGMLLSGQGGSHRIAGVRREVFDVVGAGDTVIAALAGLIAAGAEVPAAAWLANVAGSVAVGRRGTATVSDVELRAAVAARRGTLHEAKILGRDVALRLAAEARRQGRRIGFTNGCFDILHPGHVSLVAQARARCETLLVGLNTDASVQRLKGPGRPVNDEHSRALVLAALAGVDAVILFDEDTPIELIRALRPDVLVKGADYSVEDVVGAVDVRGWGGEVLLADLVPAASTTRTIARIASAGSA